MKPHDWIIAFVVIAAAALVANLIALKIASDELQTQAAGNPILGALLNRS